MSSSRQPCEKAGPGSSKTRSSKVPEPGQFGSVVWCLTVKVSRVKCHAGNNTIGVTPGPAGFAAAVPDINVAGISNTSAATISATRTGSVRIDPPKPFIQASQIVPAAALGVDSRSDRQRCSRASGNHDLEVCGAWAGLRAPGTWDAAPPLRRPDSGAATRGTAHTLCSAIGSPCLEEQELRDLAGCEVVVTHQQQGLVSVG